VLRRVFNVDESLQVKRETQTHDKNNTTHVHCEDGTVLRRVFSADAPLQVNRETQTHKNNTTNVRCEEVRVRVNPNAVIIKAAKWLNQ